MRETLAPDTIEPYVGYKWLQVSGEKLFSHTSRAVWPHGKALEASCFNNWGYEWVVTDSFSAVTPYKRGKQMLYYGSGGNPSKPKAQWWLDGIELEHKPKKRPKIILPPGRAWSYQAKACPHDPVEPECSCGIYVLKHQKDTSKYGHYGRLLVKVALWGKVIIGDKGARGEFAYPLEIVGSKMGPHDSALMKAIGDAYGVPFPGFSRPVPVPSERSVHQQQHNHHQDQPQRADVLAPRGKIRTWLNL